MKKTDPVRLMAVLLLAAVEGRDVQLIERATAYCVDLDYCAELDATADERSELLAAVAETASKRYREGNQGLGLAEWSLLAHLAA